MALIFPSKMSSQNNYVNKACIDLKGFVISDNNGSKVSMKLLFKYLSQYNDHFSIVYL